MQVLRADGVGEVAPRERALEEPNPPGYRLVLVEWHDAWFDPDQVSAEECRTDYLVRTVGFLVREGPGFLSIAHEALPDEDGFRAVTHIPLPIVERITDLSPCAR